LRSDVDVVFAEVDAGFEKGDEFDEGLLERSNAAAECTAHLAGGLTGLGECLGFDEVANGLGLGEVELAGEEGALGEFAGVGEASAEGKGATKEKVEDDRRAVGGDFNEVVAGVGVGGGVEGDDGFIKLLAGFGFIEDRGEAGAGVFQGLAEADELGGDGSGVGAAEANDTDAAAAGWRGDGGDGVDDGGGNF